MATKADQLTKAVVQLATVQLEVLQLVQKMARGASSSQIIPEAQYRIDKASEIIETFGGPIKDAKDAEKTKTDEGGDEGEEE
jgi:hypothetical protein